MIVSQTATKTEMRRGLTLVELLVVVGVVSVLAAVVLPSIKNVLSDRKSSQAAIVVKNFIEAARARAIGKNRSVAVVLERLSSRAQWNPQTGAYVSETASTSIVSPDSNFVTYNSCIRISLAEEPAPITNSLLSVPIVIEARAPLDGINPQIPTNTYTGQDALIDADQMMSIREVRIFRAYCPTMPTADIYRLLGEYLINGHEISFGNSSRRFMIVTPRSPRPHQTHFASGGDGSLWFSVMNEQGLDGRGERAIAPYEDFAPGTQFSQFKIYMRPKPIFSEMVQLPKGMCIDLSLSGFANDSQRYTSQTVAKRTIIDPVPDPSGVLNPVSDYRARFASDWIGNASAPLLPQQLRPVYIVFSPEGNLSHLWANERRRVGDTTYAGQLVRIDAVQDIFLHIGKIDQVNMAVDPDPQVLARNRVGFNLALTSGVRQNLTDLKSYIIRLSPKSGSVIAAPVVNVNTVDSATLTFGDLLEVSRRGTYSSYTTAQ